MATIDDIKKALEKVLTSNATKKALGNQAIDIIYKRTKSGLGLSSDGKALAPLKPLSNNPTIVDGVIIRRGYIDQRRKANLGEFGAPSRSNLTLSGQMLNALTSRNTEEGVVVSVKASKRQPVILDGRSIPQKDNNRKIAEYVSNDRPFLGLAEDEERILSRKLDDLIQLELNKLR